MYTLIAEAASSAWSGEIARKSFATMEEAERSMSRWARFGVDGYCDQADALRIVDDSDIELCRWSWRERRPIAAQSAPPAA